MLHALGLSMDIITRMERLACAVLVAVFCLVLSTNVILRYVFNAPLYWAEEVCVILMVWMTFIAASLAIGARQMIAVTFFSDLLSARWRRLLALFCEMVILVTAGFFFYWSIRWLNSPSAGRDIVITLNLPKYPSYAVVPLFFGLTILKTLCNVLQVLRNGAEPPMEGTTEPCC